VGRIAYSKHSRYNVFTDVRGLSEMREHWCQTWDDFNDTLRGSIFEGQPPTKGRFLFRGQGNASWSLQTSFDRAFREYPAAKRKKIEKTLMDSFQEWLESDSFLHDAADNEIVLRAIAQHYGLPTRLLDWSDSPYVAAFFAFNGHFREVLSNSATGDYVAVYALDSSNRSVWDYETGVGIVHPSSWKNPRAKRQFGWFTLARTPYTTLEEHIAHFPGEESALQKIVLPVGLAREAIAHLDIMGISYETVFPDLEGAAKSALSRVLLSLANE